MSGHSRKYKIMLTNEERNHLKVVLRSSKTCNTIKKRCQILLALDCNTNPDTTYRNCAYYLGVSLKMVCNIVKLYCESGLQRTLVLIAPYWCIPQNQDADFVACMEDIIDVYERPYARKRPMVCLDEKPLQLLGEVREPLPMRPGAVEKIDAEYKRDGTCSILPL